MSHLHLHKAAHPERKAAHPERKAAHPERKAARQVKVAANTEPRESARRQLAQAQPALLVKPNTKEKGKPQKDLLLLLRNNSVEQIQRPPPRIYLGPPLRSSSLISNI